MRLESCAFAALAATAVSGAVIQKREPQLLGINLGLGGSQPTSTTSSRAATTTTSGNLATTTTPNSNIGLNLDLGLGGGLATTSVPGLLPSLSVSLPLSVGLSLPTLITAVPTALPSLTLPFPELPTPTAFDPQFIAVAFQQIGAALDLSAKGTDANGNLDAFTVIDRLRVVDQVVQVAAFALSLVSGTLQPLAAELEQILCALIRLIFAAERRLAGTIENTVANNHGTLNADDDIETLARLLTNVNAAIEDIVDKLIELGLLPSCAAILKQKSGDVRSAVAGTVLAMYRAPNAIDMDVTNDLLTTLDVAGGATGTIAAAVAGHPNRRAVLVDGEEEDDWSLGDAEDLDDEEYVGDDYDDDDDHDSEDEDFDEELDF